ncbi:dephospho-CoA kinase [Aureococcus anophagefferens]|nr:dephospho-CoA kinase [Aureococcus anophagefferens]
MRLSFLATMAQFGTVAALTKCVGITGGIAMGKSTCTTFLRDIYGVPVHDADAAVHRLYASGGAAVAAIRDRFGAGVISAEGAVDRAALSALLQAPTTRAGAAFQALEAIVHPLVAADRTAFVADARAARAWLRRRALKRPGMSEGKLDAILARQLDDGDRLARADSVVDTSFWDKARARGATAKILAALWSGPAGPPGVATAVSFDLDNTFWPTLPPLMKIRHAPELCEQYLPRTFEALAPDVEAKMDAFEAARPKLDVEAELKHDITARRRVAFRALAAHHGDADEDADALVADFVQRRTDATDEFLEADALPVVAALRARGLRVGALTNGNAAARRRGALDFWLTASDVGASKPATPPFVAACHAAGCAPEALVHVGDSLHDDVLGALDFGCRAVHVTKLAAEADEPELLARLAAYGDDRFRRVATLADVEAAIADWL